MQNKQSEFMAALDADRVRAKSLHDERGATVTIRIEYDQKRKLRAFCEKHNVTMSRVFRTLLTLQKL